MDAANNEITFGYSLWSDEVENMDKNTEADITVISAQSGRMQGQTVDLIFTATINPSLLKNRTEVSTGVNNQ